MWQISERFQHRVRESPPRRNNETNNEMQRVSWQNKGEEKTKNIKLHDNRLIHPFF